LSSYGIPKDQFSVIADKSASSSSMQGNPIKLTKEELIEILEHAW
jgi:alcohol dehydrogenase class IV